MIIRLMKRKFYLVSILISGLFLLTYSCTKPQPRGGVFVLGGIHQSHEAAKYYSYERMGEIYQQLKPDILCVETQQKYVDDGSFRGTPYDFNKFMIPLAQKDETPIYGIDWWDEVKGEKWRELQRKAYYDTTLAAEVNFFGGMFSLFDAYFQKKDFEEINARYVTNLWKAKNEFKYHVLTQHPEYQFITEFEKERNRHIIENILKVLAENPGKNILVAIGIDHKYYLEEKLRENDIKVYQIENINQFAK